MLKKFPSGARVCFIGDSLTAQNTVQWMTVDCYKNNFPDANIEFFNCGVAGGTAASALLYLEDDTLVHNPTHAVIGFGVNDSSRDALSLPRTAERYDRLATAFENFKVNLRRLCDALIERGIEITLCTPPPYDEYHESDTPALVGGYALLLAYAEEVRKIAKEKDLPLCDYAEYFGREMQTDLLYTADHIHPNDHGYYVMGKYFLAQQGLDAGEERNSPPDYLKDWCDKVAERVEIFSGELMVVRDYSLPLEEKLKIAEEYVRTRTDVIPRMIEIATNYIRLKPHQNEIFKAIDELYAKNVLNK